MRSESLLGGRSRASLLPVVRFNKASQASEEAEGSAAMGGGGAADDSKLGAADVGAGGAPGTEKGLAASASVAGGGVSPKEAASGSPALTRCKRSAQPPLLPASGGVKATVESVGAEKAAPEAAAAGGAKGLLSGGGEGESDCSDFLEGGGGGGGGGGGAKERPEASMLVKDPLEGELVELFFFAAAAASFAISREERESRFWSRTSQATKPMKATKSAIQLFVKSPS